MRCEELRDLIPLHALDLLEAGEAAALREHLGGGCPRCAAELASMRETAGLLPFALAPEEPSPMARARLLASIAKDRGTARPAGRPAARAAWRIALAAAAAAALSGVLVGGALVRRHEVEARALRAAVEDQAEELASLRRQVLRAQESIQLAGAPGVSVVDLAGQRPDEGSAARVFWDRRRGDWRLYAAGLPPAGAGRTYQLWILTAEEKLSAGLFDPSAREPGGGTFLMPEGSGPAVAAAVTVEPEGGSRQPTGPVVMLGRI